MPATRSGWKQDLLSSNGVLSMMAQHSTAQQVHLYSMPITPNCKGASAWKVM
jgi:hypothetical protein